MEILQSEQVFNDSIKKGILTTNKKDKNYAGIFMYMYTLDGIHYFKHKLTRKYGHDKESIINACEIE
jgi:hypothetical protein